VVDPVSCTVRMLAVVPNRDRRLKPGMFVNAVVRSPQSEPAFTVPASAIVTEGEKSFVYVALGDEQFDQREVVVGKTARGQTTIVRGLNRHDRIVVEGAVKVRALTYSALRGELAIGE
jgi:multidrug efflux pump subunit AcrA (membrane-fusion protein)